MGWLRRNSAPSRETVQNLLYQVALEAKDKCERRVREDPACVDEGLELLVTGRFGEFIGDPDMTALEAMELPVQQLEPVVRLIAQAFYESYAIGLLKAPGATERLDQLKAAKKATDAQFATTMDENRRWWLAVETWRRTPNVSGS